MDGSIDDASIAQGVGEVSVSYRPSRGKSEPIRYTPSFDAFRWEELLD